MEKLKNNIILISLLTCVALIAFLLYRDINRERMVNQLLLQRQQPVGKDGRKVQDPYLANEVKNRIIKGYGDLQLCYKEFLKTNPTVTDGHLKMDWQIDTDGDVISPQVVTSPFRSDSFHSCMAEKITKWSFPEPPVKKYVTHTFMFEKKE